MTKREKVILGIEKCTEPGNCEECPYFSIELTEGCCDYYLMRDALSMLKEQEERKPRVLDYDEIADADVVWLEIWNTNANKIEVTSFKTLGDHMMGFEHGFFQNIKLYGKQWRCWTSRPTPEQMRETKWEENSDAD